MFLKLSLCVIYACLFIFLISSGFVFSYELNCYPNKEGNYLYYLNVKHIEIPSDFSKEDFIDLLQTSEYFSYDIMQQVIDEVGLVEKSFPTAPTELLFNPKLLLF